MVRTGEDLYIHIVESGIRKIRLSTTQIRPEIFSENRLRIATSLNRLRDINEGMFNDLIVKYRNVVKDYNRKYQTNEII